MANQQRTRAQNIANYSENVTGEISSQDGRDLIVSIQEEEFGFVGDFWCWPQPKFTTTDVTARGSKIYSQYVGSDCSFMNVMFMEASTGYWMRADVADSTMNGLLALAMDSYTSDVSTAVMLLEGVVYHSVFSTTFSELLGRPVYLASGSPGSITTTLTTSEYIIGFPMPSDDHGGSAIGKWYFKPNGWAVRGA